MERTFIEYKIEGSAKYIFLWNDCNNWPFKSKVRLIQKVRYISIIPLINPVGKEWYLMAIFFICQKIIIQILWENGYLIYLSCYDNEIEIHIIRFLPAYQVKILQTNANLCKTAIFWIILDIIFNIFSHNLTIFNIFSHNLIILWSHNVDRKI